MNEESCLDQGALARLHRLGGATFVREMIDIFIQFMPPKIMAARAGVEAGDFVGVERAAHFLKSGAANVGARVVCDLARQMEQIAIEKQGDRLPALQQQLEAAFAQAQVQLEAVKGREP
jgi:HPt (histidine-containing phosphotransfer) domain-containing protein